MYAWRNKHGHWEGDAIPGITAWGAEGEDGLIRFALLDPGLSRFSAAARFIALSISMFGSANDRGTSPMTGSLYLLLLLTDAIQIVDDWL